VAACHRYGECADRCVECDESRTQHSDQHTHHTYDMLPHDHITCNDAVFTDSHVNITSARL